MNTLEKAKVALAEIHDVLSHDLTKQAQEAVESVGSMISHLIVAIRVGGIGEVAAQARWEAIQQWMPTLCVECAGKGERWGTIGGDGYDDRCCAEADVPFVCSECNGTGLEKVTESSHGAGNRPAGASLITSRESQKRALSRSEEVNAK